MNSSVLLGIVKGSTASGLSNVEHKTFKCFPSSAVKEP